MLTMPSSYFTITDHNLVHHTRLYPNSFHSLGSEEAHSIDAAEHPATHGLGAGHLVETDPELLGCKEHS
jgi:hypothetical protein